MFHKIVFNTNKVCNNNNNKIFLHSHHVGFQITSAENGKLLDERENGRLPGPGWVNLDLLKYGGKIIIRILTQLYNMILSGYPIPQ